MAVRAAGRGQVDLEGSARSRDADATLELHELPRAVVAWRDRVYTILRTIDDAGMARMGEIATESHDVMEEYEWWDRVNAVWTAEKAHADILEWYVIEDFRNFGLWPCFNSYKGYALSIITEGWANFNFVGTHDTCNKERARTTPLETNSKRLDGSAA